MFMTEVDTFGYVFILISIVVGLALAHLLHGIGRLIQHPGRWANDAVHLLWVAYVFFFILAFWWWQYGYRGIGEWTFPLYLFLVGYAILLYLMAVVLLPDDLGEYDGFREYFLARRRWFFGLLAASKVVDAVDTLAKGDTYAQSMGAEYWVQIGLYCVLAIVGSIWSARSFHAAFAALSLGATILFILQSMTTR
jgi:hypothetical protein